MKREPAPQEYTCWDCPDRYCHALPTPQKLKGLIMHFRSVYKELHADHETGAADNK